ncbi:cytochrome c551 [Oceanobacillus salinisoli]|uniref:cytochrome c551 n=1 Tax=Oceanobacillus salinisoli TaxID=2678611 RepID=UPI0012E32463|nr:cytochrome c [Oceanobacillus salinisoli]
MKKWLLAVIFGTALVLTACGGGGDDDAAEEPADTENEATDAGTVDVEAGEEVYANNCAMCHGADLSGGGGPDLTQVGSKYSADEIADIVQNGFGKMQPQSHVTGEDLENLTTWLSEKQ